MWTRNRRLLAGCTMLALYSSVAAADEKAASVLAAAKAASGGAAWDKLGGQQAAFTVAVGGLTGTARGVIDGKTGAYALSYVLGPDSGAEGFDGTTAWTVDASGQPRVESGGEARANAVNTAYRYSCAFWYPARHAAQIDYVGLKQDGGVSYDVVRIVPQGGRKFDFWVDAKTHLIARMAEQQESDLHTEYYSDYRRVDGVLTPFVERVSIGQPKYDQIITTTSIAFVAPANAGAFKIPKPRAADFSFPDGVDEVSVPIQLQNNHIYVPISVNGHATRFMFDTGATNVINAENQAELGVKDQGKLPGGGVGEEKEDVGLAKVDTLQLGGLTMRNQVFATIGLGKLERVEGAKLTGLVGYEVAKRAAVVIDYAGSRMTFIKNSVFKPPADAVAVPFMFNDHNPEIDGTVDGFAGKFDIDTGSRATIDLPSPFVEKHALASKYTLSPIAVTGWGVGGPARSRLARAGEITMGAVHLPHPLVELSSQTKGAFASPYLAGNVGGGILSRFTLTLDYAHQMLYFAKNTHFADPYVFDRSGMWLVTSDDGKGAKIADITQGAAAAKAGLVAGEVITTVDGQNINTLTLPVVRAKFKGEVGRTFKLQVTGKSGPREVTLALADVV
jgi:hypothetical protein